MALTADQVREALERAIEKDHAMVPRLLVGLFVETFERLEQNEEMLKKIAVVMRAMAKDMHILRGGKIEEPIAAAPPEVAAGPVADEAPPVEAPGGVEPVSHLNAAGEPRTPEEIELERQMNEAIAAAEEPPPAVQRPRSKSEQRRMAQRRPAAPPAGPGPEERQARVEAHMDAAIKAMD